MATQAPNPATDDAIVAVRGRIYASVERFAATDVRSEGVSGIIAVDPDRGDWQLVVARAEAPRNLRVSRHGRRLAFSDGDKDFRLWIVDRPWDSAAREVARLIGY